MNEIQNPHVFRIPEANFGQFQERFLKLVHRADRLKCGTVGYRNIGEEFIEKQRTIEEPLTGAIIKKETYKVKILVIEVFGDSPKLAGWTFVAKLEHDEQLGTAVKTMPGLECPEQYRTADRYSCDHCHKALFRKDTFVVKNDQGEYKHVGRQCLRDFLGHENPDDIARYAEFFFLAFELGGDAEEWGFGAGRYEQYYDIETLLSITSKAIREYGWLSKTKAFEQGTGCATSDRVADYLFDSKFRDHKLDPEDEDKEEATKALKWCEELPESEIAGNDYLYNINLLAKAGLSNSKRFGFACSILMSYRRAMGEVQRRNLAAESKYVGEVGKRMPIGETTLDSIHGPFESQFGPSYIYRFKIDTDRILVWFTGTELRDADSGVKSAPGDIVIIKAATVKEHKEWKGWKETVISRPTFSKRGAQNATAVCG